MECNSPLGNFGQACKLNNVSEIKRVIFVSMLDATGAQNKILKSALVAKAGLQAKFDLPNFSDDVMNKFVVTPMLYDVVSAQGDPTLYDQGGYMKKTADGNYDITANLNEAVARQIAAMKGIEEKQIGVYLVDNDTRVIGKDGKILGDETYLYPIALQTFNIQNFNLPSYNGISQEPISMRVLTPSDMNYLYSVQVADANVASDSDFYSLIDVDTVISSPAITGCTAVLSSNWDSSAITGFVVGDFKLYDNAAPTVAITPSGVTESPNGTYNVAATLTAGHTYTLKVTKSKYDVATGTVVVPVVP